MVEDGDSIKPCRCRFRSGPTFVCTASGEDAYAPAFPRGKKCNTVASRLSASSSGESQSRTVKGAFVLGRRICRDNPC